MILYSLTDDSLTQTKIISASTEIREFQINDSFDNTDEDSGMDEQCSIRTGDFNCSLYFGSSYKWGLNRV